jgi:hypothetical protein
MLFQKNPTHRKNRFGGWLAETWRKIKIQSAIEGQNHFPTM